MDRFYQQPDWEQRDFRDETGRLRYIQPDQQPGPRPEPGLALNQGFVIELLDCITDHPGGAGATFFAPGRRWRLFW